MPIDLPIHEWPLSYESRLEQRAPSAIDLVVIHCTELPDMALAREYGERVHYPDKGTGNSGHYYIDTDGSVHRFVAATRVANHTRGYNSRSIGIELSNIGRYPNWGDSKHQQFTRPYTKAQIDALRSDHGIYMAGSGRINVAGLTMGNLPKFIEALAAVTEQVPA